MNETAMARTTTGSGCGGGGVVEGGDEGRAKLLCRQLSKDAFFMRMPYWDWERRWARPDEGPPAVGMCEMAGLLKMFRLFRI